MKEDSGSHFDPQLSQLLIDNINQFLEIQEEYKDTQKLQTVIDIIDEVKIK